MGDTRLEPLVLSEAERRTLENWARRRKTAQGLALRARIVLACAGGGPNVAVAARLGVSRTTVRKWRTRFLAARLDGLGDEPRPGVAVYRRPLPPPSVLKVRTIGKLLSRRSSRTVDSAHLTKCHRRHFRWIERSPTKEQKRPSISAVEGSGTVEAEPNAVGVSR